MIKINSRNWGREQNLSKETDKLSTRSSELELVLGLFPQMQRTTQKLVFVYTQSGGQPSLVLGVELQRQLKCGIYLSGAWPLASICTCSSEATSFLCLWHHLAQCNHHQNELCMGYISLWNLCGYKKNHSDILWFKTVLWIGWVQLGSSWKSVSVVSWGHTCLGGSASQVWLATGWGSGRWLGCRALIIQQAGSRGGLAGSQEKECNISWGRGSKLAQCHFHCVLLTNTSHKASSDLKN